MLIILMNLMLAFSHQPPVEWTDACASVSAQVKEGDLIFIDVPKVLFRHVAKGTGSWTSHVGIIFQDANTNWVVVESAIPRSREVRLCDFLKRTDKNAFEVRRLKRGLNDFEINKIKTKAYSMLGVFYHLGFDYESRRLFCSKFVHLAYWAAGIKVGKLQTFSELLLENPNANIRFWKWWFLGRIPWERITITPASQLNDPQFISVIKGV